MPTKTNFLAPTLLYSTFPTRELAIQYENEAIKLGNELGIRAVAIISGLSKKEQSFKMQIGYEAGFKSIKS